MTKRGIIAAALAALLILSAIAPAFATSHREAPAVSTQPELDNTDLYAFRSPDRPDTATIVANFLPMEEPASGPLFYQFADNVLYQIFVYNSGNTTPDITYQFRFSTKIINNNTFLYNKGDGVIKSLTDKNFNIQQTYTVTRITGGKSEQLGNDIPTPPVNIGPKSTPDYPKLASEGNANIDDNIKVFAGQRDDPFFADLGAIFDSLNIRKPPGNAGGGVDAMAGKNVQSIAIQVPINQLVNSKNGSIPTNPTDRKSVIGVWANASVVTQGSEASESDFLGDWADLAIPVFGRPRGGAPSAPANVQVSRVGHPMINELFIPLKDKDKWNRANPQDDNDFMEEYQNPEPAGWEKKFLGVNVPATPRDDLNKILLNGFSLTQVGVNFANVGGGPANADMLRLNVAVEPKQPGDDGFSRLGVFRGDTDGYPNGRRLQDDAVDVMFQMLAGATSFSSDLNIPPNNQLGDGVDENDVPFLSTFPYVALPHSGFGTSP